MPNTGQAYRWMRHALPVMLFAGAIRFFNFAEAQLTNDELSAWSRLDFDSLGALLKYGVQVDGHPALTHIFLWFWTGLFGDATWVIKLPFVLMSLGAILIIYRLTYDAFGRNAADLAGVILAAGQMFPVFALQARPYAMGFLICSALAWIWYRIISGKAHSKSTYLWMGCLLALSVYTHYFSGLLAVVIWASGWLFYQKLDKKWYFISAALGIVLFLPHLPLTLHQLGYKGIGGWLDAPKRDFLFEWVQGLFNFHTPSLLIFGSLLLVDTISRMKTGDSRSWILPGVFGAWFLAVFAIGFAYSILLDPVLHHGSLFFAAPFLVVALSSIAAPPGSAGKIITLTMAVLLVVSLVLSREHYTILKSQPYASTMQELDRLDKLGGENLAIVSQTPQYLAYYKDPGSLNLRYINRVEDSQSTGDLISTLLEINPEYFFTDGRTPALTLAASQHYNHIEEIHGFTFSGFIFSNSKKAQTPYNILIDSPEVLETRDEFVPIYTSGQGLDGFTFADEIGGLVHFAERPAEDVTLVIVFSKGDETVHWTGGSLGENGFDDKGTTALPHQFLMWNSFTRHHDLQGIQANIYLWNPQKTLLKITRRQAFRMEGNPNMYGQLGRRP